jgi:hypothetical protein
MMIKVPAEIEQDPTALLHYVAGCELGKRYQLESGITFSVDGSAETSYAFRIEHPAGKYKEPWGYARKATAIINLIKALQKWGVNI